MLLKTIIPNNPYIQQAWNKFVLTGTTEDTYVRPVIEESWIRCRQEGVNHLNGYCEKILSKTETQKLIDENKQLIEIAKPLMKTLFNSVQGFSFIVVLVNENGIVLDTLGDADVLDLTRTINFLPGADWSEESVGTNAIGTSLFMNESLQVSGAEHYCSKHHGWTCSASPIHNSKGKIIGCLNISGLIGYEDSHYLGMVSAAVHAIESQLHKEETKGELISAHKHLTTVMSTISEGILTIDMNWIITDANPALCGLIGIPFTSMIGKPFPSVMGECDQIKRVLDTGERCLEEEVVFDKSNATIRCTIKAAPIKDENLQVAGAVITFREIKQVHKIVNKMVGAQARFSFNDIIGNSEQIQQVLRKAKIASRSTSTVLLLGESGTGKEVFAQAIHHSSNRSDGPFIAVNCAAIPRELIQSELFGYADGAFTGAKRGGRPGKFELADGGTLLLDEIGDMSLDLQVNLLRVLQEKNVVRVGGEKPIPINVRVVATTNKNLRSAVADGTFREDLYYRLNVITLHIPPLRDRNGDVGIFAENFLGKMSLKLGKTIITMDSEVKAILNNYNWPGNIRELENILEYAVNMAEGNSILKEHLPSFFRKINTPKIYDNDPVLSLAEAERQAIEKAIKKFQGNMTKAAKVLGIARTTLYEKIKKYNL